MDDRAEAGHNGSNSEQAPRNDVGAPDREHAGRSGDDGAQQSSTDPINAVRGLVEHVLEEGLSRVKGEGGKLGTRASQTVSSMLTEFGVAQRRDHEDLELRVAQLEHRVRLLESAKDALDEAAAARAAAVTDDADAAGSSSEDA